MHIFADYHTHTIYSHGKGTVEENVVAAIEAGLSAIAISEHAKANVFYGVKDSKLMEMRREINRLNKVYGDRIDVLMGLEANLTGDGLSDAPLGDAVNMFDFIIIGYHRGILPKNKFAARALFETAVKRGNGKKNAEAMLHAAEKYPRVTMISHPGLYIPMDIDLLSRGAAELGVALELNGARVTMTNAQIQLAAKNGANFVINSDAHHPSRVGEVAKAIAAAEEAGLTANQIINAK